MDRPLLFVAMPFGVKKDPGSRRKINFDEIYEQAIAPAADAAGVEVIRADQELMGGFIHAPMYERLLLSEIVVADLTFANPNVFYELGIRHAAKPKSTILLYLEGTALPFDVRPLRAVPYRLEKSKMTGTAAAALKAAVTERLKQAFAAEDEKDSPLFQVLDYYTGIQLNMEAAPSFRKRVQWISQTKAQIADAVRGEDLTALAAIEQIALGNGTVADEIFVSLLIAYRDLSKWPELIDLADRAPDRLKESLRLMELLGMALNRTGEVRDGDRAVGVLKTAIAVYGENPETCGVLGRVYKDRHIQAKKDGAGLPADGALAEAITYYRKGFEADPCNYYPGINLATLLHVKGDTAALQEMQEILPIVAFAVRRLVALGSDDYWAVATMLELAFLHEDWEGAKAAAARVAAMRPFKWQLRSTLQNLDLNVGALASRGVDASSAQGLVAALRSLLPSLPGD